MPITHIEWCYTLTQLFVNLGCAVVGDVNETQCFLYQEWAKRQWNRHYQHSPASSTRSMKRASRPARPAPPRTSFIRNKPQFERRITKPSDTSLLPENQARDTEGVTAQLQELHQQLEKRK